MFRPLRPWAARGALLGAVLAIAVTTTAHANVYTDINNWDLHEYVTTASGGTQYHTSTGSNGIVEYRWLDATDRATVISGNSCSDYTLYGSPHTFNAGVTLYRTLFTSGFDGLCFVLRGRTAAGTGSMYNKDGRVNR
jgi:hypothetical protein